MKKEISAYIDEIRRILTEKDKVTPELLASMLIRIKFYQHERFIHLIVTMTFAVMTVLSVILVVTAASPVTTVLMLLFLGLTIPYVVHYYFLENSVQLLYKLYYELENKLKDK